MIINSCAVSNMLIRERLWRNQIFLFEPDTLTLRIYRTGDSSLIKATEDGRGPAEIS